MRNLFGSEPTLILGFVRAVMVCLMAWGFDMSEAQFLTTYAVVEGLVTIINRSFVTPVGSKDESGSRRV